MKLARLFVALSLLGAAGFSAAEPNDKAGRYHSALQKRPSAGYLFERFEAAWLETDTHENLENWLDARAKEGEAADRLLLAFYLVRRGEDERALAAFETALEADAANGEAWFQRAQIESRQGRAETALKSLDAASETEPNVDLAVKIGRLRAEMLIAAGKAEEAGESLRKLVADFPDDDDLHDDVVEMQVQAGLEDEAQATLEKLIASSDDPYRQVMRSLRLAELEEAKGEPDAARERFAATLDRTGHGTWLEREVLARLERLFRKEDDVAGFRDFLAKLREAHPQRVALLRRQAEILAEQGEEDAAVEAWRAILELTPGDRAIREAFVAALGQMQPSRRGRGANGGAGRPISG